MYLFACICKNLHTYKPKHVYMPVYICTYMSRYMCICIYTYVYVYIYSEPKWCTDKCTERYTYKNTNILMNTSIHTLRVH